MAVDEMGQEKKAEVHVHSHVRRNLHARRTSLQLLHGFVDSRHVVRRGYVTLGTHDDKGNFLQCLAMNTEDKQLDGSKTPLPKIDQMSNIDSE